MSVRIKEPGNTRDWRKFIEEMSLTGFAALSGNIPGIYKGIKGAIAGVDEQSPKGTRPLVVPKP